MTKAIPINKDGSQAGPAKSFPDRQWDLMKRTFGKNIAWKKVEIENISKTEISEVSLIARVSTKKATNKKI